MTRYVRLAVLPLFVLACIVSLTACGSTGAAAPPPPPPAVSVSMSPSSMTLNASASQSITATVANATNTGVNWNATAGTIAGAGNTIMYTAPGSQGTYSVTATSQADTSKSATTMVTVTPAPPVSVTVSPSSVSLSTSASQNITATVSNSSNTAVTWSTDGGTISGTGNTITYTAPATEGTYTVTATSQADPTKSAGTKVGVTFPPGLINVAVSPTAVTLNTGATQGFTATVSNTSNTAVTWSATAGTITGSGNTITYTAPSTAGSYSLTATSVANTNKFSTASITVNTPPPPPPAVSVTLSPLSLALTTGASQSVTATVANSSNTAVTWSATAGTITGTGNTVTYNAPTTAGSYSIKATSVADPTKSATAPITVSAPPPPPVSVSLSPSSISLTSATGSNITATVSNSSNTAVTWSATGGAITGTGNTISYTPPNVSGVYSVTATSVADPTKSATCTVTLNIPVSVTISPLSMSLLTSASQSVTATVSNTSNTAVTWSTNGGSFTGTGNTVTYNAPAIAGNYSATATSVADPTKSASAAVTVSAPPPPTLSISPLSATLAPGGTQQFTASTSASNPAFTWSATSGSFTGSGSTVTYTAPAGTGNYTVSVSLNGANINPATASVTVTSQTILGMTIPTSHPRLWWTPARLAQAKSWYTANPFTPSDDLSIAWSHAVNGTDCSVAINDAINFQIPPAQASPTGNGSDAARGSGEITILTYDWCFDQFTDAQKATLISNWNTWLTAISQQGWGGPGMPQDNYFWGNLRNELEWGIATYWENTATATSLLNDALVTRWANAFVPPSAPGGIFYGGIPHEGTQYGGYLDWYPTVPLQSKQLLGRDAYAESNFFKQSVFWLIYATMPAQTYDQHNGQSFWEIDPFGDDELFVDGGVLVNRSSFENFMTLATNYWGGASNLPRYARQWLNTAGAAHKADYLYQAQDSRASTPLAYSGLPLDFYGPGKGQFYARAAWDSTSTVATWQLLSVSGAAHFHEDVGNFHLWRNGRWLVRETTGYSNAVLDFAGAGSLSPTQYQDTSTILAHNCLVFAPAHMNDNSYVRLGAQSLAKDLLPPSRDLQNIHVLRVESQPGYAYSAVDTTAQYLWGATTGRTNLGSVGHVEREIVFVRSLETLVVFDRVLTGNVPNGPSAANVVNTFTAHYELNPTVEDGTHLTAVDGTEAVRTSILIPSVPPNAMRIVDESSVGGQPSGLDQFRLEVDNFGAAQRYFLVVFQGRSATGANITASVVDSNPSDPTTGTFTVTLHPVSGSNVVIVFNKGQTSIGGSVTINGSTRSLLNRIQNVTIGDNGPVWETIP